MMDAPILDSARSEKMSFGGSLTTVSFLPWGACFEGHYGLFVLLILSRKCR